MQELIIKASEFVYSGFLYDFFFAAGFVAVFIFFLWRGKYFGVSPTKSVLLVLIVYPLVVLWMHIQYWIDTGSFGGNNIVRSFADTDIADKTAVNFQNINRQQLKRGK